MPAAAKTTPTRATARPRRATSGDTTGAKTAKRVATAEANKRYASRAARPRASE